MSLFDMSHEFPFKKYPLICLQQGSGIGGRGYTPAGKILKIPPLRIWKKYTPPSAARSAAAIFLAKFRKLTLIQLDLALI